MLDTVRSRPFTCASIWVVCLLRTQKAVVSRIGEVVHHSLTVFHVCIRWLIQPKKAGHHGMRRISRTTWRMSTKRLLNTFETRGVMLVALLIGLTCRACLVCIIDFRCIRRPYLTVQAMLSNRVTSLHNPIICLPVPSRSSRMGWLAISAHLSWFLE
jgi:hypothetical protein